MDGVERVPQSLLGTVAFVRGIAVPNECDTGGLLELNDDGTPKNDVKLIHSLQEPLLFDAIEAILSERSGGSARKNPYLWLQKHAVQKLSTLGASARGEWLDVVCLLKTISVSSQKPISLQELFQPDSNAKSHINGLNWKATFQITRIVGGKGVFNRWLNLILTNPDAEVIPGLMARYAAVRPECAAGADGAFAAFSNRGPVIVTFACAWYEDGVTLKKWKDQADTTSRLDKQFSKSKQDGGILCQRGDEIVTLVEDHKFECLRILVELPTRKRPRKKAYTLEDDNFFEHALVVDERNCQKVLGIQLIR